MGNYFTNPEDGSPKWDVIIPLIITLVSVFGGALAKLIHKLVIAAKGPARQSRRIYVAAEQAAANPPSIVVPEGNDVGDQAMRELQRTLNYPSMPAFLRRSTSGSSSLGEVASFGSDVAL